MVEIFLISHEDVSVSLLQSAELILGTQKNEYTYSLKRGEDVESFGEKISKKIEELKTEKILILTDMFGGTPSNIVAANLKKHDFKCITGMNLPMLLDALLLRKNDPLEMEQLVEQCLKTGKEGIIDIEKMISEKNQEKIGKGERKMKIKKTMFLFDFLDLWKMHKQSGLFSPESQKNIELA